MMLVSVMRGVLRGSRAAFGRSTGLLIDDLMLLSRSVILVDREGKVRYIQVVPDITHLPDMERAFEKAEELAKIRKQVEQKKKNNR